MLDQRRIGEYIAAMRKERGLTQSALADALCVTHQAVSKWENGAALPDLDVLVQMRGVFGVSVDDILDCRPPQPKQDPPASGCSQASRRQSRIVVQESETFDSPIHAEECSVLGQGRFRADVRADELSVMGVGTFEKSVDADQLTVFGLANIGGRTRADSVSVSGCMTCAGGLTCDSLSNRGALTCGGGLTVDSVDNSGAVTIGGGLTVDCLSNHGYVTIGGQVTADVVDDLGALTVGGSITVDQFTDKGKLAVGGDVTADAVAFTGLFEIGGRITADSIAVELHGSHCKADSLVCDSLVVTCESGSATFRDVTAERVDIDGICARVVRADSGRIGAGCRIDRLECGPDVIVLPGASVALVTSR